MIITAIEIVNDSGTGTASRGYFHGPIRSIAGCICAGSNAADGAGHGSANFPVTIITYDIEPKAYLRC